MLVANKMLKDTLKAMDAEIEDTWNYIAHVYAVDADDVNDVDREKENLRNHGYHAMADDLETEIHEYEALKSSRTSLTSGL